MTAVRSLGRRWIGTFRLLFVVRLVQWPIRALSRPLLRRLPRSPLLVAFGATSDRFADNPAYAFLACAGDSRLRCVWISGSRQTVERVRALGLEAELRWSWRGVVAAARAGWHVYGWHLADINVWVSDGARTFNLWHGVGVKRIQRARVGAGAGVYRAPGGSFTARVFADDRHVPDLVLSTSPGMTPVLSEAFAVPPERCLELGYPRNDHLAAGAEPPAGLVDEAICTRLRDDRVVGYFPTFRDDSMSIPGGAPGVTELARVVTAQGGVLLFKAHDASHVDVAGAGGLVVLPPDADLNAYLGFCDVLVTDYSSVASDFLLLGRPIVLFLPDLHEYEAGRGFALDPSEKLPGVVVRSSVELYGVLADLERLQPPAKGEALLDFYWAGDRGAAAGERIREVLRAGS